MAVSLSKGNKVSLSKQSIALGIPKLNKVNVGLGWDVSDTLYNMDLDAWALALTDEKPTYDKLVYFGNKADKTRCIVHTGDNLTGVGDGDDEVIKINLADAPDEYKAILLGVTIYRAKSKRQSFKDVKNAFIRVFDNDTNIEICKYSDKFRDDKISDTVTMIFGAFKRVGNEWEFNAIGEGIQMDSISDALGAYSYLAMSNILTNNTNNTNGGKKTMAVNLKKGGKV